MPGIGRFRNAHSDSRIHRPKLSAAPRPRAEYRPNVPGHGTGEVPCPVPFPLLRGTERFDRVPCRLRGGCQIAVTFRVVAGGGRHECAGEEPETSAQRNGHGIVKRQNVCRSEVSGDFDGAPEVVGRLGQPDSRSCDPLPEGGQCVPLGLGQDAAPPLGPGVITGSSDAAARARGVARMRLLAVVGVTPFAVSSAASKKAPKESAYRHRSWVGRRG